MFEFLWNGFYLYPCAHVLIPSLIFLFGSGGLRSATMVLSLCTLWEIFEFLIFHLFGSYIFFFDGNLEQEVDGNSLFLDYTHALLGIAIAWYQVHANGAIVFRRFETSDAVRACVVGIFFAFFSSFSWGCNTLISQPTCSGFESIPWGNLVCWIILLLYAQFVLLHSTNQRTKWIVIGNATVLIGLTTIKYQSSAIMAYLAGGVLILGSMIFSKVDK
tara:strand:+ start:158 stop:808 length:651 start_codon:yes stop_codon:yes gene_type:complete